MFNIVKRRDFMLAGDLPTLEQAEQMLLDKYGRDYIVVKRTDVFADRHGDTLRRIIKTK